MNGAHVNRRRRGHLGLLLSIPLVLTAIGWFLVRSAQTVDPRGCPAGDDVLPDFALLSLSIAALIAGSVAGISRHQGGGWEPGGDKISNIVGTGAFALMLIAVTGVLVYEALGVQQAGPVLQAERAAQAAGQGRPAGLAIQDLEPITYYVRCAVHHDKTNGSGGWVTALAFAAICFVVGHWLWVHPGHAHHRAARVEAAEAQAPAAVAEDPPAAEQGRMDTPKTDLTVAVLTIAVIVVAAVIAVVGVNTSFELERVPASAANVQEATGTYRVGIAWVIGFVFAVFVAISLLDVFYEYRGWSPIGLRVQEWAGANPWFVATLLLVLGALLAHFLANEIHY